MYDELIKRLRESKNDQCYMGCFGICGDCRIDTELKQAADAIEELTAINERQLLEIAVLSKPRWIPVTERLPEYMENVLVTDGVFSGMGWRDWYDHHGTKPREDYWISPNTNVNDLGITHWMPLPEPPKESEKDG